MSLEIKHLQTSCGDPKVVFEHSGNYMIDGDEFSRLRSENAELKQKLRDQCISCPVKMQEDDVVAELKAENEKLKAQFVPLYEELKRVKDENENLKNNLFVVETDIAMAARWRKVSEELPQNGQDVWAYDSRSKSILLLEYEKSDEGEGFIVFPYMHDFLQNITQWMPFEKPKAPEVK